MSTIKKIKRLFLLDGLGALLTAFLVGVVLPKFETAFGVPTNILALLSKLALVLAVYSLTCSVFVGASWRIYLKLIAIANLLYCLLTLSLLYLNFSSLQTLGLLYFLGEIGIIGVLVFVEFRMALRN